MSPLTDELTPLLDKHAKKFGLINNDHGICGIIAVLLALYYEKKYHAPEGNGHKVLLSKVLTSYNAYRFSMWDEPELPYILQEINFFLSSITHDKELQDEIITFTKSFGGRFSLFSLGGYEEAMREFESSHRYKTGLSIAFPPNAVLKYLQFKGVHFIKPEEVENPVIIPESFSPSNAHILGLSSEHFCSGPITRPYNGLSHWVYEKGGTIYSWGQKFKGLDELNKSCGAGYKICYCIQLIGLPPTKSSKGSYVPPVLLQQNETTFEEDSDEWFSPKEKEK